MPQNCRIKSYEKSKFHASTLQHVLLVGSQEVASFEYIGNVATKLASYCLTVIPSATQNEYVSATIHSQEKIGYIGLDCDKQRDGSKDNVGAYSKQSSGCF